MKIPAYIPLLIIVLLVHNPITSAQESPEFIHYVVQENDNVYQISKRYSVPIDSIRVWNYLDRNYMVVEGMELIIKYSGTKSPRDVKVSQINFNKEETIISNKSKAGFHLVKGKENLLQISLLHHVPVDSIRLWNNLNQNDTVFLGQRLIISGRNSGYVVDRSTKAGGSDLVADTSGNFENKLSTDSLIVVPKEDFLPVYSESEVKKEKSSFKDKIWLLYHKSNYLIGIILFMNLFFFISAILLSIVVFVRRLQDGYIGIKRNMCEDRYRDFITEWLYEEQPCNIPESLLRELQDKVYREVFTSNLLSLQNNLTGESADKLVNLFHLAGLDKFAIQKVNSYFWHIKAKGFRELAQMKITSQNHILSNYLNSKNTILRIEAQMAWIQLNANDPLSFYDDPNIKLNEWGQLNSLVSLKKVGRIPDFRRWLKSPVKSVALFALKMSGIYKQFDNVDLITQRLDDADSEIRYEAICSLGKMAMPSPIGALQQLFPKEDFENKKEILHSLIMISETSVIPFFEEVLINEMDINLRILGAKGIILIDVNGTEKLSYLRTNGDPLLNEIIMHAIDDRI